MRKAGRRVILLIFGLMALALVMAIGSGRLAGVPDWFAARQRAAPVRRVLAQEFGDRLGRVKVPAPLDPKLPEYGGLASGVTLELTGDVEDADLCAAMIGLYRSGDLPAPILSVTVVRPDDGMTFEALHWDPRNGRLQHFVGEWPACECMLVEYLDGRQHACANGLIADREVPIPVDSAMLERYADGTEIPWENPIPGE